VIFSHFILGPLPLQPNWGSKRSPLGPWFKFGPCPLGLFLHTAQHLCDHAHRPTLEFILFCIVYLVQASVFHSSWTPQSRSFLGAGSGTEIIPGKHPDTRHQNKAVAFDFDQRPWPLHNRYIRTDTCVRWGMAVTCYITVINLYSNRFNSKMVT
jgi:hypothetical protein